MSEVVINDERRIREEIELRNRAIEEIKEWLPWNRKQSICSRRHPIDGEVETIAQWKTRVKIYEEAILFLATSSKEKDRYIRHFLKQVEKRQVDREVGILEARREVLERKRLECWGDMAVLLDN